MTEARILYVDDEPDIRDIAMMALELDPEIEARSCSSGREALGEAAVWKPDLILLDVMMPEMDGPETLRRLRESEETDRSPSFSLPRAHRRRRCSASSVSARAGSSPSRSIRWNLPGRQGNTSGRTPNRCPEKEAWRYRRLMVRSEKFMTAKKKILVCDDDPLLLELIDFRLRARGYDVVVAKDGNEAMSLVASERPSLVVLDAMMPRMGGFEVLTRIKSDDDLSHIPVIMLTARKGERDIVSALERGAEDYLVKPFIPDELIARLSKILSKPAARYI